MWLQGFREGASEFLEHVEPDSAKGLPREGRVDSPYALPFYMCAC